MTLLVLIALTSYFACYGNLASAGSGPCAVDDSDCLNSVMNEMFIKVMSGISELGIDSSDPLLVESLSLNLPIFQFKKLNRTYTGLSKCSVNGVKLSSDLKVINFVINCGGLHSAGGCMLSGYVLYKPLFGSGKCNVTYGQQNIHVYSLLDETTESDGIAYLQLGEYSIYVETLSQCTYSFDGYYNGNKTMLAQAEQFANSNWKEFTSFENLNNLWYPLLNKITPNINKYLLTVPASNIIKE